MRVDIIGLFRYPVKSCAGHALDAAVLDAWGMVGDRRWLIVRADNGQALTQRDYPAMATLRPHLAHDGVLALEAANHATLTVSPSNGSDTKVRTVTVWRHTGPALDAGDDVARWLSNVLHVECRLVALSSEWGRGVGDVAARHKEDRASFVDGYPLLLTSEASLTDLNASLFVPRPMDRFRPNLVVRGASAWTEDTWTHLTHVPTGTVLRAAKPCARCAVTTIDQATGEADGPEPLRTLRSRRRDASGKVLFGLYLLHDTTAAPLTLHVGDELRAESR